jgi:hypothetical protein
LVIDFALLANLSVESDSWKLSSAGEIIAIIVVLQLPAQGKRKQGDPGEKDGG